jgi:hypothetical protein
MSNKLYLNEKEAAERYNLSRQFFQRARWRGEGGPSYVKLTGKILYPILETDAWFKSHLRKSTSENRGN